MRMMKMIVLSVGWVLPLLLFLTACRSTGPSDAPASDARPEVTLRATDSERVRQVARQLFEERGYSETSSPLLDELIFDRPAPEATNRALRVRLRLFSRGRNEWRLTGVSLGVDRWRTELETETVVRAGYSQIQDILETIRLRVEQSAP